MSGICPVHSVRAPIGGRASARSCAPDLLLLRRAGQPSGGETDQAPPESALIRAESRDSFRATVLWWVTPLLAARCISGWAAFSASCAAALSPPAIAVSTFLTKVRIRDLRA